MQMFKVANVAMQKFKITTLEHLNKYHHFWEALLRHHIYQNDKYNEYKISDPFTYTTMNSNSAIFVKIKWTKFMLLW